MPTWAVRLSATINALVGMVTASIILRLRHWFKVFRVTTRTVATQMVKVKSDGNWSDK